MTTIALCVCVWEREGKCVWQIKCVCVCVFWEATTTVERGPIASNATPNSLLTHSSLPVLSVCSSLCLFIRLSAHPSVSLFTSEVYRHCVAIILTLWPHWLLCLNKTFFCKYFVTQFLLKHFFVVFVSRVTQALLILSKLLYLLPAHLCFVVAEGNKQVALGTVRNLDIPCINHLSNNLFNCFFSIQLHV